MFVGYLCIVLSVFSYAHGYHILGIFPPPPRSHYNFDIAIMKTLARAGHEVTVFSHSPPEDFLPNYHAIRFNSTSSMESLNFFTLKNIAIWQNLLLGWHMGQDMCDSTLQEPAIKDLLKAKGKFDALIIESFFNECLLPFAHILNIPIIQVVTFSGFAPFVTDVVGTPYPYSYVPNNLGFYHHPMGFWDRLGNTFVSIASDLGRKWYYLNKMDLITRKHLEISDLPRLADLEKTTSLVLINDHQSMNIARPVMPNVVNIAGVHIQEPKPIPEELKQRLDRAKDGVIYFSFGSNLKSVELPKNILEAFIKAFSKLKQTVLWKWESDQPMANKPDNVVLGKWFPQADLLGHPNIRFFITHGGLMSMIESFDKGVPLIGIPIFGDQEANLKSIEARGVGIGLDLYNITETTLDWIFGEILKPKYRENAKRYSALFKDRAHTPKETVQWWVEYIIRHKGARHLRAPGIDMPWYQYYLLDVLGFSFVVVWIGFQIIKTIICNICIKQKKQKLKKN